MNSLTEPMLSQVQTRKIPATSLMRTWSLGTTQAKIAATYLSYIMQKNFLSENQKRLAKDRTHLKAALQLLGSMGYLRGAIMKVGQLLANLPQIMGPEISEVLGALYFEAPPMHYSLIREVFLDEIGREPEDVFSSFDRCAFAAASLGQVHRARMHDGTEVAVKIQYPDIARTIDADFKALALLLQPIRFTKNFQYILTHIEDAREVFMKEVDYLSEATYMEENRKLFLGSGVVVPQYIPEISSKRVLTMEYLPGKHLQEFLADGPSQEERDHFGEMISYAHLHSYFGHLTVYADLHPGNFIFMEEGRLGFIDFGCYRRLSPERWKIGVDCELSLLVDDREAVYQFLTEVSCPEHPEEVDQEWLDKAYIFLKWLVKPVVTKGDFDFADKAFMDEGVKILKDIIQIGYYRVDSFYNWTDRAVFGHRSLMYQLGCKIDFGAIYRAELDKTRQQNPLS